MPKSIEIQKIKEALCQIARNPKFLRKPYAKSIETENSQGSPVPNRQKSQILRGGPMQNRRPNKKSFSFVEFHDFFKRNLISKKFAVQPRRLARKIRKNQHF